MASHNKFKMAKFTKHRHDDDTPTSAPTYVPAHISTSDNHSVNSEVTGADELNHNPYTKKKKKKRSKMKKLFSPKSKSKSGSKSVSGASANESPPSINSRATATAEAVGLGRSKPRPTLERSEPASHDVKTDRLYPAYKDHGDLRSPKKRVATPKEAKTLHQRGIVYERIGDYNKAARYYKQSVDMHNELGDHEGAAEVAKALDGIEGKHAVNLDDDSSVYSMESRAKAKYEKRIDQKPASAPVATKTKEDEKKTSSAGGIAGFTGAVWGGITSAAGAVGETVTSAATTTASSVGTTATSLSTAAVSVVPGVAATSPKKNKEKDPEGTSKIPPPSKVPPPVRKPTKSASEAVISTTVGGVGGIGTVGVYGSGGLSGPRKESLEDGVTSFEYYCSGFMHLRKREYEEARDDFEKAINKTREPRPGIPNTELARTREYHGDACVKLSDYANAEQSYKKAVELYQREQDEQEQSLARIMMKRGDNQIHMNSKSKANLYYNVSMRLWKNLLDKERANEERTDDAKLCHFLCNVANLMIKQNHYKSAEDSYKEIIVITDKDTTDNFELIELGARANNAMGNIRYKTRSFTDAIHYYEKALELRKKNHLVNKKEEIDDKEETIGLYTNLGRAYFQKKETEKATKCFQKANRILMAEPHKDEMFIVENWIQMGKIRFVAGEYEDARELYNDALTMSSRIYDEDDDHILLIHHDIALTYCRECDYEEGIKVMEEVLVLKKKRGEPDLYLAKVHLDLCSMYIKMKSIYKIRTHLKNASEIMDDLELPDDHPYERAKTRYEIKLMKIQKSMEPSERRMSSTGRG